MESLVKELEKLTNDTRISTLHLALYVAILQCREEQGGADTVILPKEIVMRRSRIRGISAYYKGLKELDQYGVLRYWSRKSGGGKSRVILEG